MNDGAHVEKHNDCKKVPEGEETSEIETKLDSLCSSHGHTNIIPVLVYFTEEIKTFFVVLLPPLTNCKNL